MANLNNIEKLIQMATIDHMYEMLQKIKNDITMNQLSDTIFDNSRCSNNFLPPDNEEYKNELKDMNDTVSTIKTDNVHIMKILDTLLTRINSLEVELKELKIKNDTLTSEVQKINETSKSESSTGGGHITLKIEEKNIDTSENLAINADEMDKIKQLEKEVEEQEEEEEAVEEEEQEEEVEEEEQEEVEEQLEKQEEEEEEVGTDEEQEEEQEVKKQNESLEENEDEEVFEIEIDDITYFTTDEENGILYEATSDGEVGKKVGIIKNGEPIFS